MEQVKVLSLNVYTMGHVTYQNSLEQTFANKILDLEFISLHLTDYYKQDFLGRLLYFVLSRRIPGFDKADYDFSRFRIEIANSFFARRCLERHLKNYQPHVLHIHTQSIALLAASLLRQLPSVVSLDATAALLAKAHPFPAHITYKPLIEFERKCFHSAAHIITWSDWARRSVIDDYKILPQKVTTIHPSIPLEFFSLKRGRKSSTRKPRLLFVGNDFVRKGGEDLLAVFLEHFSEICELDIVTNAAIELPAIPNLRIHRGVQSLSLEILHLYQESDIFVMPTREEVYGIVFTEAMAAGLPCIGTTVMAVPELVQNGYNGFTIPPGDRKALYQSLHQLIDNPDLRLSMGLASRKLAIEKFDAITNGKKIADIFKQVSR
jgi:alpha-maltose-1-phosphate synthase